MSDQVLTDQLIAVLRPKTGEPSSPPDVELLAKRFADGLNNIWPAIALAGAAYPIVLVIGFPIVVNLLTLFGMEGLGGNEIGQALAMMLVYGFFGAIIGLIWASIVAFAVLPQVYLFVRSLKLRGSIVRLGAFCGGLVGFVAVMPFFIGAMSGVPDTLTEIAVIVLFGPALTTIVGQFGGAWGGWRVGWYERAVAQAAIGEGDVPGELRADSSKSNGTPHHRRPQFGIRHLLIVSIWISLLLTAIRLSGLDYLFMLLLLGGWIVYQAVTLWVGGLLAGWLGRRKARRQSRST